MKRRDWLVAAASSTLLRASAAPGRNPRDSAQPHVFNVAVTPGAAGLPVRRSVLGQNVQWVYAGDGMLDISGQQRPFMVDKLKALRPSSLRFPGGAQSDSYRWRDAMGPLATRRENLHFNANQLQPSIMGTQEFLELCETVSAMPVITVNTVTGSAAEAADWLRLTNRTGLMSRLTGRRLPSVPCWEIGNEPYLQEGKPSQRIAPAEYVQRANAYIRALRAVDPSIKIGVPLRTAKIGGLPATPYPDFAHDVLTGVTEPFDFISNHNAYMPYLYDRVPDESTLFWGTVGASATVATNLDETAALSRSLRPGWTPAQAITEFNALFSLGKGDSDNLIDSQVGALYVADVVRMMAEREDLLFCQYWSLSANWQFGAITETGGERPGYIALRLLEETLRGIRVPARTECGTFEAPRAGAAAPAAAQPLVTTATTREGNTLRVLLINKDIDRQATGQVSLASGSGQSGSVVHMATPRIFATGVQREFARLPRLAVEAAPGFTRLPLTLPPASVTLVTLELRAV